MRRPYQVHFVLLAVATLLALSPGGCGDDSRVTLLPPPDPFEPNDTPGSCTLVALDFAAPNLSLHETTDEDYFCFLIATVSTVDVRVEFSHLDGDIDLELLDAAGTLIAESRTQQDVERVSEALSPRQYRARVFSPTGQPNAYAIEIQAQGNLLPDPYEPNDDPGNCAPVSLDFSASGLTLDVRFDEDFFCFSLTSASNLVVTVSFVHADGNLDLMLLDPSATPLAESRTQQSVETISQSVPPGQYFVRVWSSSGETNSYSLSIQAQ